MIAAARLLAVRPALFILFLCTLCLSLPTRAAAADHPTRRLFVGGDWKSQLTNYQQKTRFAAILCVSRSTRSRR